MQTPNQKVDSFQDREIERRVAASLKARRIASLRHVDVQSQGGQVTLRGNVHSFYEKQIGYQSARQVEGVWDVVDRLNVVPAPRGADEPRWRLVPTAALGVLLVAGMAITLLAATRRDPNRLPVHPVQGRVANACLKLAGATVMFHPKEASPESPRPAGRVGDDGSFKLTTYEPGDGAPAGEYVVTVELRKMIIKGEDYELGPNVLPPQYASFKTSTLQARVVEGPNRLPELTIAR